MTYLDEPVWQHMQKEPSDKLGGIQRHDLVFITVGVVTPGEEYFPVYNLEDTVIADSYPVGIPAEVLKYSFDTGKWRFAIDYPLLMFELSSKSFEGIRLFEMTNNAGEDEITRFKTVFEVGFRLRTTKSDWVLYRGDSLPVQGSAG